MSSLAIENNIENKLEVQKEFLPIQSVRALRKTNMLRNDAVPNIEVDSYTFEVRADGKLLSAPPVKKVPLNRKYFVR